MFVAVSLVWRRFFVAVLFILIIIKSERKQGEEVKKK